MNLQEGSLVYNLNNVTVIVLYTGSNGKKGCTCKCLGCYMGSYSSSKPMYQGKIEQIHDAIKILPNLKTAIIFGNPDISVDASFCNEVAKFFSSRGIEMIFSTSGIGGANVIKNVLTGVNLKLVLHVDFSVDSLNDEISSTLKGVDFSLKKVVEGIKYCDNIGIPTRIKPTIWTQNANENWLEFKEYFDQFNVSKIEFHFGSVEGCDNIISSIPETQVVELRNKISEIGKVPYHLATDEEYLHYSASYTPRCSKDNGVLYLYLEEDGVKAASSCAILTAVYPKCIVPLKDYQFISQGKILYCPVSDKVLGFKCKHLHPICSYWKLFPKPSASIINGEIYEDCNL
jgi:pyruvate-formate lyase-activating enzyme